MDIVELDITTGLRSYLLNMFPNLVDVILGQDNRVSMPLNSYAVITPLFVKRLSTTRVDYNNESATYTEIKEIRIQLDFYGDLAADYATQLELLWRSGYSVDLLHSFAPYITPLYSTDARQLTLVNGENQFESRWMLELAIQPNQTFTTHFDMFNSVELSIDEADRN